MVEVISCSIVADMGTPLSRVTDGSWRHCSVGRLVLESWVVHTRKLQEKQEFDSKLNGKYTNHLSSISYVVIIHGSAI